MLVYMEQTMLIHADMKSPEGTKTTELLPMATDYAF